MIKRVNVNKPILGAQIDWSDPLSQGLVGCWLFNEGGGSQAFDIASKRNNVNLSAAIFRFGSVYTDSASSCSTQSNVNTQAKQITLITSVYWGSYANDNALLAELSSNFNSNDAFIVNPNANTGFFELAIHGGSDYNNAQYSRITVGWHNYAFVFDTTIENGVQLYIDGCIVTPLNRPLRNISNVNFGAYPLYLMSRAGTSLKSTGGIKYTILYNRALSATEIRQLHELTAGW